MIKQYDRCSLPTYSPNGPAFWNELPCPRKKYHAMLDEAMNETKEGDFFLPLFVAKIMKELHESHT